MKRYFLALLMSVLIVSLAFGATEIRLVGRNDVAWGSGSYTTPSPYFTVVYRINADIVPFSQDNATKVGKLYWFAAAVDNTSTGTPYASSGSWFMDNNGTFMSRHWTGSGAYLKYDGTRGDPTGGSGTPAGSSGQLQYNNGGSFGAIPGTGFNSSDNSTTFPGPIGSVDPGNGNRRIQLLSNTSYTCPANENSVLMLNGELYRCENGTLRSGRMDSSFIVIDTAPTDNTIFKGPLFKAITLDNVVVVIQDASGHRSGSASDNTTFNLQYCATDNCTSPDNAYTTSKTATGADTWSVAPDNAAVSAGYYLRVVFISANMINKKFYLQYRWTE